MSDFHSVTPYGSKVHHRSMMDVTFSNQEQVSLVVSSTQVVGQRTLATIE